MKIAEELSRLDHNIELLKQGTLALEQTLGATLKVQHMIAKEIDDIHSRLHNICNYVQTHHN